MKHCKLKHVSLFIVLLVLFSTTATTFTLFDDLTPSFGISACDTDDDISHVDETPQAVVPAPLFVYVAPPRPAVLPHPSHDVIPVQTAPFLNHISRAPPLHFS